MALPLEDWSGSTIGTVPIGQGIAVTPVQMAAAYAAIGNHGVMRTPYIVERVGSKQVGRAKARRVVSRATADARDGDAPERRRRGHRHRGGDPRLHRRRQDRNRGQA